MTGSTNSWTQMNHGGGHRAGAQLEGPRTRLDADVPWPERLPACKEGARGNGPSRSGNTEEVGHER